VVRVMLSELRKHEIASLKVVYSDEPPIKPLQDEQQDNGALFNRRPLPASIAFVPPVAGLLLASEVIRDFLV